MKSRDQQIAIPGKGKEVALYKMHGDIASPDEVIICKDDYERYARKHELFQNQLGADLVSKTFLFLGFSFTDPHLDYMLGHLRSLLEDNKREHFAVMRKARVNKHIDETEARKRLKYEENKQALQIEDLQRYSIQTHLIDSFDEVTDILESIERRYFSRNIFVSGSAHECEDFGMGRLRDFCVQLGERLIDNKYRVISGMGLNVGDSVVKGALLGLYHRKNLRIENYLTIRPFPRALPAGENEEQFNTEYRKDMVSKCGVAIFIAGTSRSNMESLGVLEEYKIAISLKKTPIPIGVTGFAARKIWETMRPDIESFYSDAVTAKMFADLNNPDLSNDQLLDVVFEIMQRVSDR